MLNNMASPVFAKLFGSNFYDCMQLAVFNYPTITLREDDPAAMRTILGFSIIRTRAG
jgi:hypothetical protein